MASPASNPGLRTIFSFFLGLMLTAFIGVGVYTFHPPPDRLDERIQELSGDEQAIRGARAEAELSEADRARLQELRSERRQLGEEQFALRRGWNLSTSIVLIVFSTLVLVASLVRPEQLPVISNGLLLGGIFTMLYGVGWIANSESSITRFVVMTAALAITVGLGYARFARRAAAPSAAAGGDLSDLEQRVAGLEGRLREAGRALGNGA